MRTKSFLIVVLAFALILLASLSLAATPTTSEDGTRLLPPGLRAFKAIGAPRTLSGGNPRISNPVSSEQREYRSDKNERILVTLVKTRSDSNAYATFLTHARGGSGSSADLKVGGVVGTRSLEMPNELMFFKGSSYVSVKSLRGASPTKLIEAGRELAAGLDNGEGDIPVLVKHLPDWQNAESQVFYAVDLGNLKVAVPNQPVLDTVSFDGGAEAVSAAYGPARMILVEFTTPQLATENDQRILAKIQELRTQGQPTPVYKRVGNYSVFVFNAANEQDANQLIGQVKYEQIVQWLGDNPNWLKQAQKEYTETTLGVLVTVIKTSGLAAMVCFGVGGFLGAVMFARRRAQVSEKAYSDAGGMMRLNLDEMTGQTDPGKLIGSGSSDSSEVRQL